MLRVKMSDRPEFGLEIILQHLNEVSHLWFAIGIALSVPVSKLREIEASNNYLSQGGLQRCLVEMIQYWLDTTPGACWEQVVSAREKVDQQTSDHLYKSVIKVSRILKSQVDGDGSSSEKYGCKVFYRRRGVNAWNVTFAVFPRDKSDKVEGDLDEVEGPSCTFDLKTDTIEIVPKEQPGWILEVTRKEVTRASVDAYTGTGKPPSCEMIVTAASSSHQSPPFLKMDVTLKGPIPPQIMKLEEKQAARNPVFLIFEEHHKQTVDTAIEALNKWVTMRLSKFRTMGAPGSGKTSVLDLTMGKPPATKRESTDCTEPPTHMVACEVTIAPMLAHEMVWETVTKERMNEMVRKALKAAIDQPIFQKYRSVSERTYHRSFQRGHHHSARTTSVQSARMTTSEATEEEEKPLKVIADMVDQLEEIEGSMELMNVHWVFTQDTGGQPCYQSVAPLLLRENSCSVITTKLNEKFDSKPEFAFFINGKSIPMSSAKIQLTNLQMIETLVKSQASVNPSLSSSQAPTYIIVGTHEDKTDECEETIKTKNAILEERLSGLEDQRIDNGGSIIFPINAVNPDKEERRKSAARLRKKILESPGTTVEERVNIRWFGLLLHLITEDKDVYALSECLEAGKSLKMNRYEIFQALKFFHGLGIIIHFRIGGLEGVIIVKVKVVFSTLSLLLGISFIDRDTLDHEFKLHLNPKTQKRLQVYGRFNKELLSQSQFKFSMIFTAKYFLDLLEHVTAITEVEQDEYFLPSALACATDEEIKLRVKGEPWIIRLTREEENSEPIDIPPPLAYLPSLVINVLKSSSSKLPSPKSRFSQQYSNAMSLSYCGGVLHFIQRVHQIEVYFNLCEDQPQKCHTIRSLVLAATEITEEKLNIPFGVLVKHDAFLCPCEDSSSHVCIYNTDMKKAQCEESEEYYELKPSQQRWLDEAQGAFGDSKPAKPPSQPSTVKPDTTPERDITKEEESQEDKLLTSDDLLDVLERLSDLVSDKLQKLGLKLGLKITTLKKLKDSCSSDDFGQSVMLSWLNQEDNVKQPSWRSLVDALESDIVKERPTAQNIRDWLNSR